VNREFDRVLDECIDRLSRGGSIEECLAAYPELAGELRPLLVSAQELMAVGAAVSRAGAKAVGRERLLRERARLRETPARRESFFRRFFIRPQVWAPAAAALIIALTVGIMALWPADEKAPMASVPPSPSESSPEPSSTPSPTLLAQAGLLEIRVTDAPAPEISAVYLTLGEVGVHRAGKEEVGWETVLSGPRTFELLHLRGIEEILGSKEIEAGRFTQIRLEVLHAEVVIGGQTEGAKVSSGEVKLVGAFEVKPQEKTVLTLDFDAEHSVIVTGAGVRFKPVVKLIVGGLAPASSP